MVISLQNIKVRVKFYASLREKMGIDEKVLQLEKKDASFSSLVNKLAEAICGRINIIVNGEGALRGNVIVSVNGMLVRSSDLVKLNLNNGDRIDIMPLPSGG